MTFPPKAAFPPKAGVQAPKTGKKKHISKKRQDMLDKFAKRMPYGRR